MILLGITINGNTYFCILNIFLFLYNSHDGSDTPANSSDIKVLISSLRSHIVKLRVQKKAEKYGMDLLSEDEPNSGIWNSITRYSIVS